MADMTSPTGNLIGSYYSTDNNSRQRLIRWIALMVGGILVVVVGAYMMRQSNSGGGYGALLIIGGIIVALSAFFLVLMTVPHALKPNRNETIDVHQDGFVLRDLKTNAVKHSALWTELDDIFQPQPLTAGYVAGETLAGVGGQFGLVGSVIGGLASEMVKASGESKSPTVQNAPLTLRQGKLRPILLDGHYNAPLGLYRDVRSASDAAWFKQAVSCIDSQQPCKMGTFVIDHQGVTLKKKLATWDNIIAAELFYDGKHTLFTIRYYAPGSTNEKRFANYIGTKGETLWRLVDDMRKKRNQRR